MPNFSDIERDTLQILLNNEILMQTLIKTFRQASEEEKPEGNELDNDENLGQKYRAFLTANRIINTAFDILQSQKIEKSDKKPINRAR